MTARDALLDRLGAHGCRVDSAGRAATCPAHEDRNASLSIATADRFDGVLVKCHAGCAVDDILAALDMTTGDLFDEAKAKRNGWTVVAEYAYTDAAGTVLYVKERRFPKDFRVKRPNGNGWTYSIGDAPRVLYRMPDVLAAIHDGRPVYVVEGEKDADALAALGHTSTTNYEGAAKGDQRPKWRPEYGDALRGADVVIVADKDEPGRAHAAAVAADLAGKAASVRVVEALSGKDTSDHLAAGHTVNDLVPVAPASAAKATERRTLDDVHGTFRRWLGEEYDLAALDVVLAVAAVEQLGGDPAWLLVVSGPGNAKTETVSALAGAGAWVTSTITSEGALLSATSKRERSKDATGGLLRKMGPRGLLVVKDVTSILSMGRELRASVLAALREVYDGRWERNVGTDGGRTLTWEGRLVLVGAVTTAYDSAHGVISAMGDRFALVRMDSSTGRVASGRQALRNVDHELQMRAELAEAIGGLLAHVDTTSAAVDDDTADVLLRVADLVTLTRTAVERDQQGRVVDAHAPEMPTRFAKMLGQIVRGSLAIGATLEDARAAALRVAHDSMPPLRFAVLADVWLHPYSTTTDVTKRLQRPRSTVDRTLQELHVLQLVEVEDSPGGAWRYTLAGTVDPVALDDLTRKVSKQTLSTQEGGLTVPAESGRTPADISGEPLRLVEGGRPW